MAKSFFSKMFDVKSECSRLRNKDMAKTYLDLVKFTESGSYSTYKKAGKLAFMLNSGYSSTSIADNLGISETTVRVHIRNLSNELYGIFGNDFFDLYKDYNKNSVEISKRIFVAKSMGSNSRDLIPQSILAAISRDVPENDLIKTIDIHECRDELIFLLKHSNPILEKAISQLDIRKLEYLTRVLDGLAGNHQDKYYFISLMKDEDLQNLS